MRPYDLRNAAGIVEQREDIRFGEYLAQRFDYLFATPHAEKPVMYDRAAHGAETQPDDTQQCTRAAVVGLLKLSK